MSTSHIDDENADQSMIGVGMGGSCPSCRAPIDLGQEFCLECGSPIRFTNKPRKRGRKVPPATDPASAGVKPRNSGFPWVPFFIVVVLVSVGIGLALVDNNDTKKEKKDGVTTDAALPSITNEPPTTQTSTTPTITLEDCDPARPLNASQPALPDNATQPGTSTNPLSQNTVQDETIPEYSNDTNTSNPNDSAFDSGGFSEEIPTTDPQSSSSSNGSSTVTVDQNGSLCPESSTSTDQQPSLETTTTPTSTNAITTENGEWPANRNGWTVIVAGYQGNETRARQRAADMQEDGFKDAGVLFSSNFRSLCPGFYVVFSGVFDNEQQAKKHSRELSSQPDYAGTYTREIRTDGPSATGCKTTQ